MTKAQKLLLCIGCRDNFYNGNNDLGIKECWCLEDAEVVKRMPIPLDLAPPYKPFTEKTLSCHRRQGCVMIDPEKVLTSKGYWK